MIRVTVIAKYKESARVFAKKLMGFSPLPSLSYIIYYIFSVSSFLKWARREGEFGSAISDKNCVVD